MQAWEAFDGVWERMRRATAHREAAAREWSSWLTEYEPYGPTLHVDDDGNGTLWIRQYSPVPPALAIELGEWLYNLRAALDYTAYALAIFNTKSDPPPNESSIQFPIYDDVESFRRNYYRIKPLAEKHRDWIESMQPYSYDAVPRQTAFYWMTGIVSCRWSGATSWRAARSCRSAGMRDRSSLRTSIPSCSSSRTPEKVRQ